MLLGAFTNHKLLTPKSLTEVVKVERCGSKEYKGGQGYNGVFEYSDNEKEKRCTLVGEGNHEGLTLTLELAAKLKDPSPTILARFNIPDQANLISIRLFDQSLSMDVHLDRKPKTKFATKARAEGDYWAIYFRAHTDPELYNAKRMLRRVENVTLGMPDAWFKYRNYFTRTPNVGDEANESQQSSQASAVAGENLVNIGGGYTVRFTNFLATQEWLSLSGHENIRPPRPPIEDEAEAKKATPVDPAAAITRDRASKLGDAYHHSSLPYRTEPAKGT